MEEASFHDKKRLGRARLDQGNDVHFKREFFALGSRDCRSGLHLQVDDAEEGELIFEIGDKLAEVMKIGGAADGESDLLIREFWQQSGFLDFRLSQLGNIE